MRTFSYWFDKLQQSIRSMAALGLLCVVLVWSFPAQAAATRVSSRMEEQILQVIRKHPEVLIESVQAYQLQQQQQQQQKVQQARQAFIQELETNPQTIIGDSPITGAAESKTVLVEFSDFECPYCAKAHETLKKLMEKYPDRFKLVYKHFPLFNIHAEALPAARSAWAATQQGHFWEYQDALFSQQDKLGEALYVATAKKLNLDLDKFNSDRNLADASIQKDFRLAEQLGLSGTPFFILNGQALTGSVQLADFEKILALAQTEPEVKTQESANENQQTGDESQKSADVIQESPDKS
ncbi:MAG: thioredoxin domain-containing protein [Rhizonema sp. NSF051]|nr:thioredoxin domain-containing protein [Rhizonema sp. NSF051]